MPSVAPIVAAPAVEPAPALAPVAAPAAGVFQAELASSRARLASLPSVRLAEMVSAAAAPAGTAATLAPPTVAPATAVPGTTPVGTASTTSGPGAAVLRAGERYLGVPYRWGGTDPATGLDCSGFVQRAFRDVGVSLPRVSVDQARQGTAVASLAEARPGDLVFWRGDGRRPNHIGIYAGDGRMLVAPRTGDVVKYQDISRTPHGIRRIV